MVGLLVSLLVALAGLGGAERPPVPRILCERPASLGLRHFEDRSAQVMCSGRILARIAVPG